MEMVVVPPPWSHFAKPGSICAGLLTQHLLDGGVHKYSLDLWIGRSTLDQLGVPRSPEFHIDGERVFEHRRRHQVFPLLAREKTAGHGRKPNVSVKPDLMALMAGDHRPPARLCHIADQKPRPAIQSACVVGKSL